MRYIRPESQLRVYQEGIEKYTTWRKKNAQLQKLYAHGSKEDMFYDGLISVCDMVINDFNHMQKSLLEQM